jgi:DNA-binding MarR family transcriptional regulator
MHVLSVIRKDSHRANAITQILKRRRIECDQNQVVQSLNALEKKGYIERFTSKTWLAKDKAERLFE